MLPIIAVLFALAGAPASTPVTCVPTLLSVEKVYGLTAWSDTATVQLDGTHVCAGDVYLGASRRARVALAFANPGVDLLAAAGVGALVTLHEAEHVATGSMDECLVERRAFALLPAILKRYLGAKPAVVALEAARQDDAGVRSGAGGCG